MKLDPRIIEVLLGVGASLLKKVWDAIVDHGPDAAQHAEAIAKAAKDAALQAGLKAAQDKAIELGIKIAFEELAEGAQAVVDEWEAAERRGRANALPGDVSKEEP